MLSRPTTVIIGRICVTPRGTLRFQGVGAARFKGWAVAAPVPQPRLLHSQAALLCARKEPSETQPQEVKRVRCPGLLPTSLAYVLIMSRFCLPPGVTAAAFRTPVYAFVSTSLS